MSPTAEAVLWTGAAIVLIPDFAFFAAASSRAASTAVTSVVSSWSDGVSWFIQIRFGRKTGHNWERTWGVSALAALLLVLVNDAVSLEDCTTMDGNKVEGLLALAWETGCCS